MSAISSCSSSSSHLVLSGTLLSSHESLLLSLLVDSGADKSFLDENLVKQAQIPTEALPEPWMILDLDGKPIALVTHRTKPLILVITENH